MTRRYKCSSAIAASTAIAAGLVAVGSAGGVSASSAHERHAGPPRGSSPTSATGAPSARRTFRYPASYFTGPLGRRVPLPPKRGAFLILQPGSHGCDWACVKKQVAARERATGRRFDGIANAWRPNERERVERWVHSRGSIPIIAGWSPGGTPSEIATGARDARIVQLARYLKQFRFVVMVRLFHEFDLAGWAHHTCGQPFVDMWRRVVDIFRQQRATNVGFWWSPTEGGNRSCIASSYPGDAYVDWAGSGWYNWCYVDEPDCWSTPLHSGWADFAEVFDYPAGPGYRSQHDTWGPRKPFVVGETNTVLDSSDPSRKASWYRGVPGAAARMEYLRGVMVYDSDVSAIEGAKANFKVDHPSGDATVYEAFIAMARHSWFNTQRAVTSRPARPR